MDQVNNQTVTVGSIDRQRRNRLIFIGCIVALLVNIAIAGIVLAPYIAARKNQDETFLTNTPETQTAETTTTTTTDISNIYISYGFNQSNRITNENFPLDSTLIYNSEDKILFSGYITTINISLHEIFYPYSTIDNLIHFIVIWNNIIVSKWDEIPSYQSSFITYKLPEWKLIVKSGSYLCISTDNGNISSMGSSYAFGNRISATQSGKAYLSSNFFSPYNNNIQPEWNGQNIGIALSFTVVHNPKWMGTTPQSKTTISTPIPDINTTYGFLNEDVVNEGLQLNSLVYFNWEDVCVKAGYVISINIHFCTLFQSSNTLDGLLWIFITNNRDWIAGRYALRPSNSSLIQSFSISQRELFIKKDHFLAVGTFTNNSNKNNTICLRQTGYYYSTKIVNNITDNTVNLQWSESQAGIALSYTVFSNAETAIYDIGQPDF